MGGSQTGDAAAQYGDVSSGGRAQSLTLRSSVEAGRWFAQPKPHILPQWRESCQTYHPRRVLAVDGCIFFGRKVGKKPPSSSWRIGPLMLPFAPSTRPTRKEAAMQSRAEAGSPRPHPLDDPPRHAGSPGNRTARVSSFPGSTRTSSAACGSATASAWSPNTRTASSAS